ncbi:MAG: LamG domain-containing protein, partial [Caulobacteraceae bacterium]|nr:LamG domain-containing protein [Caulobacteraceae bacterium]
MPWPVHPTGFFGARGDSDTYRIERSLRFNSADSAYLSRTPTVNGNQKIATLSLWVKRTKFTPIVKYSILTDSVGSGSIAWLFFNPSDQLQFYINGAGDGLTSSAVYRDTSAWYHIVCAIDTTQTTSTNRIKLYVNGNQITQFSGTTTYYSQDATPQININSREMRLGQAASDTFDGYMTEVNWVDGQALTPSSFGETDAITGRWKAKAYSGTYGTNG